MNALANFFLDHFIAVYFVYGLSFFLMGLAILLEIGHTSKLSFAIALPFLAGFGLVHGSHEWFEMFLLIYPPPDQAYAFQLISLVRLVFLGSSFLLLVSFGARLISDPQRKPFPAHLVIIISTIWILGLIWVWVTQPEGASRVTAADVYTRYSLAIPGAILVTWGLFLQRNRFIQMGMPGFGRDVVIAALAFAVYGIIGQLFVSPSAIFPSEYLNNQVFIRLFGFPVQVLRAAMATIAAVAIIHSLRAFEVENRRRIEDMHGVQLAERKRLEELRAELLHRTVKAQEAERQRIARELHDETGQTMTALGMGLRGLSIKIPTNPDGAVNQAQHLEKLAANGLKELQALVGGLHPPHLDDLGLSAALRWYANEINNRFSLPVKINSSINENRINPEARVVLFRIAQEAITNAVRHAVANNVAVTLTNASDMIKMKITDDGQGFNVNSVLVSPKGQPCWGLLGMIERAELLGGKCIVISQRDSGTSVDVEIPLIKEGDENDQSAVS